MKRLIEHYLKSWRDEPARKSLLIRGARQVGKTFTVRKFGEIVPMEVKSGAGGWLKSLRLFLESRHGISPYGVRFSAHNFSVMPDLQSHPLYAVGAFVAGNDVEARAAIHSLA